MNIDKNDAASQQQTQQQQQQMNHYASAHYQSNDALVQQQHQMYIHQYHDNSSQHSHFHAPYTTQAHSIDDQIGNLDSCISELANVGNMLQQQQTSQPQQQVYVAAQAQFAANYSESNPNSNSNDQANIHTNGVGDVPLTPPTDTNKKQPAKRPSASSTKKGKKASDKLDNHVSPDVTTASPSVTGSNKRRKKDPQAPKAPLNGYLVYFNEERVSMRQKNPQMSFGDLTKEIANKWKELPQSDKQKYINEAEADKERYVKEMEEYKQSDAYKQYLKENQAAKQARANESQSHVNHNQTQNYQQQQQTQQYNNWSQQHQQQQSSNDASSSMPGASASYDNIAIFSDEFMDHNKNREQVVRELRKEVNKLTQQNSLLSKHLDSMKQSMNKIENDLEQHKISNQNLQKILDLFRQTMLKCFSGTPLPNTHEYPNPSNIDDYVYKLFTILNSNYPPDQTNRQQFVSNIKSIFSKFDFSTSFVDC